MAGSRALEQEEDEQAQLPVGEPVQLVLKGGLRPVEQRAAELEREGARRRLLLEVEQPTGREAVWRERVQAKGVAASTHSHLARFPWPSSCP